MTWKIPLTRIEITDEHKKVAQEITESTYFTEGKHVKEFEKLYAEIVGVKHCIACSSGTTALMLIFSVLREKYNRVICPALTFPATLNAALTTGYSAILKDASEKDAFLIDAEGLENLQETDIIIPVHLLGYPVKIERIMELSKEKGFAIVEDACEAIGTTYNYKRVGSFGIANAHSFYPTHIIQSGGELGCITTNDDKLVEKIRSIKNHGRAGSNLEFKHKYVGYNFKTTEFSAAMATIQLKQLDNIIKARYQNVKQLNKLIKNKDLILPEAKATVSYLCYSIGVKDKGKKAAYLKALNDKGIETRDFFPCLANQEAYAAYNFSGKETIGGEERVKWLYPKANYYEQNYFYITCHQSLTEEEIKEIAKTLNKRQ